MSATAHAAKTPGAEFLERARSLAPVLTDRARRCEENRSVLEETVEDFSRAGFYRMLQPARYGGDELSPIETYRVAMELAKGCPSSAWCLCLVTVHNWELALLPPQAAADVWTEDAGARISSSYAPFGAVEAVSGGFRISGRWPWSSGCDHCSWVFLGAQIKTSTGPDHRAFLLPRSDYRIDDTWFVSGLQGTGSKDIVVDGAFVPAHRTHSFAESLAMTDPGRTAFTSRNYRYPFGTVFAFCLASVTQGIAEGALETFQSQMARRRNAYDGAKAMGDPFVRERLANAATNIANNRRRIERVFSEMDHFIDNGVTIPLEQRTEYKWEAQRVARDNADAVTLLFKASGGSAIRLDNPMQRFFRDIQAATNHAFLNADKGCLNRGGILLGLPNTDFVI
jgi:3-hydroxy-9,10-secoandrosta-1,3,5(10)-triene-9,17-dione monooxygenase